MNSNYEILEQILRLDSQAGAATVELRAAQKELVELAKKTKTNEELIAKTQIEMNFLESETRRQYKKVDELEERKAERSSKLFAAKNDDEHRSLKREVDNLDRDLREINRRIEEAENRIEAQKAILQKAKADLSSSLAATAEERTKAEAAEQKSSGKLDELNKVRLGYVQQLDDRLAQHYQRVFKLTRNPNGPIVYVPDGACGNCHMKLSPQQLNLLARKKDVEFCPSCNHILLPG